MIYLVIDNYKIYNSVKILITYMTKTLKILKNLFHLIITAFNISIGFFLYLYFINNWQLPKNINSFKFLLFMITILQFWMSINLYFVIANWAKILNIWYKNLTNKITLSIPILMIVHMISVYCYAFIFNDGIGYDIYKWISFNWIYILICWIYPCLIIVISLIVRKRININKKNDNIQFKNIFNIIVNIFVVIFLFIPINSSKLNFTTKIFTDLENNKYCYEKSCIENSKNNKIKSYIDVIPKENDIQQISYNNNQVNINPSYMSKNDYNKLKYNIESYNKKNKTNKLNYKILSNSKNYNIEIYNKKPIFKEVIVDKIIYKSEILSFLNIFSPENAQKVKIDNNNMEICLSKYNDKYSTNNKVIDIEGSYVNSSENKSCYIKSYNPDFILDKNEVNNQNNFIHSFIDKLSYHYLFDLIHLPILIIYLKLVWIFLKISKVNLNKKNKLKQIFSELEIEKFHNKIFYYITSPKGTGKTSLISKSKNIKIISISEIFQSTQNNKSVSNILDEKVKEYSILDWMLFKSIFSENSYKSEDDFNFLTNEIIIIEDLEKLVTTETKLPEKELFFRCEEIFTYFKRIHDYFIHRKNKPIIILTSANSLWDIDLSKEEWLKDMLNDIAIDSVDFKWNIYQKSLDNFAIKENISLNLYTIFDYEKHLYLEEKIGKIYNQNIRNLDSIKSNNNSLFQYIDQINSIKSDEGCKLNFYFNPKYSIFKEYWNSFDEEHQVSISGSLVSLKLHLIFKKISIILYKNISKLPIMDINNNFITSIDLNENLYTHFNNRTLLKYIVSNEKKENDSESLQREYIEYLFWQDENINEHKKFISELNLNSNLLPNIDKTSILDWYINLMNKTYLGKEPKSNALLPYQKLFYSLDVDKKDVVYSSNKKYYSYTNIKNKNFDYNRRYYYDWDTKEKYPLFLMQRQSEESKFFEKQLHKNIREFVDFEFIELRTSEETFKKIKESKPLIIDEKNVKQMAIKRIYTYNDLMEMKENNKDFLIANLKFNKIKYNRKNHKLTVFCHNNENK